MTKQEKVTALRTDPGAHYNCAQSVLMAFAEECGISQETACRAAAHFGGGMRMGSVCGAVTGALMVLGLTGRGEEDSRELLRRFREENGGLECADLLKAAHRRGEARPDHCSRMIAWCVDLLEEKSGTQEKTDA